jgi:suppressor of ftsI
VLWVNNPPTGQTVYTQLSVPQIAMQPGEVIRLRMLNGTNDTYLPLVLPGMNCYLIAFDGINLGAPAQTTLNFTGTVTQFNLNDAGTTVLSTSPGNRIEMLIQAPSTPGTYTLSAVAQMGIGASLEAFNLAEFVVSGAPVQMSIPAALPLPTRETPIADSEIVASRTVQFHQSVTQPTGFDVLLTGFWPWINNSLFDEMSTEYTPAVGTAEEWTIINQTSCGHPFHIHVNSFELLEINGVPQPSSFWDTFMVPPAQAPTSNAEDGLQPQGSIKIRIRFKQWTGKTVFHCHILDHEDTGMMKNIIIT